MPVLKRIGVVTQGKQTPTLDMLLINFEHRGFNQARSLFFFKPSIHFRLGSELEVFADISETWMGRLYATKPWELSAVEFRSMTCPAGRHFSFTVANQSPFRKTSDVKRAWPPSESIVTVLPTVDHAGSTGGVLKARTT